MTLWRAPFAALLSTFLALGAAAGVVRVPSGASSAALSAPAALAGYQAGLVALDPSAARSFLSDGAARDLLRVTTPDMYASSLVRAHEIVQLDALPARHKEVFLRRELMAIEALPVLREDADLPAKHRAMFGSEADAARIARAAVAWDTLDEEIREDFEAQKIDEPNWARISVAMRASMVSAWWHQKLFGGVELEPGSAAYLARVRLYERKAAGYMTDYEATALDERIKALQRITKRLPELRAAAADDSGRLRELDAVAELSMDDPVKAKTRLDKSFGLAPTKIPHRFIHDPKDKAQRKALAALAKRLNAEFRRLAAGTSAEKLLEKAAGAIQIGGVPAGSDGAYQAYGDKLALPADVIDHMLILGDRRFEDFETDDAMIQGLAVLYLPTYVHETTHRLQGRKAVEKSLTAMEKGVLYGHEDEHEAYLAQELFVREFTAKRPVLAAWARSIPRVADLWDPVVMARQGKRVSRLYTDVPGGAGRRALGLLMAIRESNQALTLKPRIEQELSRRRRSASGERRESVRLSDINDIKMGRVSDRLLRRWRDIAGTSGAGFADLLLGYFDEGEARVAELKTRLRVLRNPKLLLANAGDARGFDRVPSSAQEAAGLGGVPKVKLIKVLSARGGNSRLYEGSLRVDGRYKKVAVKVAADVPEDAADGWAARLGVFNKERDAVARMTDLLPKGWAPRFYGAVDAGGNPSLAFEIIKGKDLDELTVEESRLLTRERIDEVMAGIELLVKAGIAGVDSPQFMMLTEDQTLNGVLRRRGDIVFMDAANAVDEGDSVSSPQNRALALLAVKRIGERFPDALPGETIKSLQAKIPMTELGPFLRALKAESDLLPTPDPARYAQAK